MFRGRRTFKKEFLKKSAYLTNSWTNAVISLLLALNIKKGDEVIIPACTFVACANVVEMVGGKVIFADINPDTKLMDIEDCLKKITKKTKAIMLFIYMETFFKPTSYEIN